MPTDAASKGEDPSNTWEDVEDSDSEHSTVMPSLPGSSANDHWSEHLPNTSRKRTKVSLPFRWSHDAEYLSELNKHPKDQRGRQTPRARAAFKAQSTQRQSKREADAEDTEELSHPPSAFRRQDLTGNASRRDTSHLSSVAQSHSRSTYQELLKCDSRSISPAALLGSGNDDPFSALPTDLPRAFVMERLHGIRDLISGLVSKGPSGASYGSAFAAAVMSHTTSHEPLFYSTVHAEMIVARAVRGIPNPSPIELEIGAKAIQLVSREMRDPKTALLDANIWAVLNLGYAGGQEPLRSGQYPRQSFLRELQSVHLYCKLVVRVAHIIGLIKIVNLMGGLEKIKTPGTAAAISFCGVTGACRSLSKPIFPFIPFETTFIIDGRLSMVDHERDWALSTLGRLGSGFWEVWGWFPIGEVGELCKVIQHICDFTIIVENHVQGRWTPRTFTVIIDQRNFVQHSLMSLKSQQELYDSDSTMEESLYECCRLAAIIYSLLVIFPLPPVFGPFEGLADQLHLELTLVSLDDQTTPRSRLLIWALVMGAIAALGCPERPWFLSQIRVLSTKMKVEKWAQMKEILLSFLWLPSTNDPDGQDVWMEMQEDPLLLTRWAR